MSVSIFDFLDPQKFSDHLEQKKVIFFSGKEYPFSFFSFFLKKIRLNYPVSYLNLHESTLSFINSRLEQSFLGTSQFYWLGNIEELSDKDRKNLLNYLDSYKGPNYVGVFISQELIEEEIKDYIICDYVSQLKHINNLLILWPAEKYKTIAIFLQKALNKFGKISLDQACLFAQYAVLLGTKSDEFFQTWFEKIATQEQSLFTLSKYFFAKDATSFFRYWNILKEDYPPVFWTTYWSEQLFKAFSFIQLHNLGNDGLARQIAYRLPFSFIQYDWKKNSIVELKKAHEYIYDLDCKFKNGGSDIALDIFYGKFFAKKFV